MSPRARLRDVYAIAGVCVSRAKLGIKKKKPKPAYMYNGVCIGGRHSAGGYDETTRENTISNPSILDQPRGSYIRVQRIGTRENHSTVH